MSKADEVYRYTYKKIMHIEKIKGSGEGKRVLAEMRRGVGKHPGEMPSLWGMIFDGIDETLLGKDKPSYAEWGIYTALTLYALHSQGFDGCANVNGPSVGTATADLVETDEDIERIQKHLNLVVTSGTPEELSYHLRGIVTLLRSNKISLDYARLAKEFYLIWFSEESSKIKLQWGRDFYKKINRDRKGEN